MLAAGCIVFCMFLEEVPFSCQFGGGGGPIFIDNVRPKPCWRLAGVSLYSPNSIWRAGRLDQIILLVWPNSK